MIDSFTCNNISLDLVLKVPLKIIIYKSMSSVLGTTDILSVSLIIEQHGNRPQLAVRLLSVVLVLFME